MKDTFYKYSFLFTFVLLLSTLTIKAQDPDKFTVFGKFKIEEGNYDFTKISITRDGLSWKNLKGKKSFEFKLDYGYEYIFSFEKRGYVSKKIKVDTRIDKNIIGEGFPPFQFQVHIFKQYDGVNTVIYNQPVGVIRYDSELDDFGYDTDYTKSIRSKIKKVEEETAKAKQEEERLKEAQDLAEQTAKEKAKQRAVEDIKKKYNFEEQITDQDAAKKELEQLKEEKRQKLLAAQEAARKKKAETGRKLPNQAQYNSMRTNSSKIVKNHTKDIRKEYFEDKRKKTTKITVTIDGVDYIYRKVKWYWGAVFYFKDNENISYSIFSLETQ